jgi:periplasmic divalent cation tolerance protein
MLEVFLVTTTSDDQARLEAIARVLIQRSLAACVQIGGPLTSHYRWQGETTCSVEWTLTAKTRPELIPEVEREILAQHNYELPEILWGPVFANPAYQAWVEAQTASGGGR